MKKSKEDLLHDSEEKFRLLTESSLTGVYHIQDGKFSYVNKAFAEMFGFSVDKILNNLNVLDLIKPEDRLMVEENIRLREKGDKDSIRYTFRGVKKDSSMIYAEVHGSRIYHTGTVLSM